MNHFLIQKVDHVGLFQDVNFSQWLPSNDPDQQKHGDTMMDGPLCEDGSIDMTKGNRHSMWLHDRFESRIKAHPLLVLHCDKIFASGLTEEDVQMASEKELEEFAISLLKLNKFSAKKFGQSLKQLTYIQQY